MPDDSFEGLAPGTVLENRYEVLRLCGQGGMSTVYVARDLRFSHVERLCAVKEMVDRARDQRTRVLRLANFEREASLLATLSHAAIPKIYDYFSMGGLIYLVLEFIEGKDLEKVVSAATEPIPEDTLIEWGVQILDVLSYLHEHQPEPIVFRDMKPSNIMLRSDGALSLIDFGIARTFQPLQRGTMIGTEGYAPPEQYRGIAEPRGDIYALGATLHHLATRVDPRMEPPFTFDQRRPRSVNPGLSAAFEEAIVRAVGYAPGDRFPSAAAMQQALIDARRRGQAVPVTVESPPDSPHPAGSWPESAPAPPDAAGPVTLLDASAPLREPARRASSGERTVWAIQTGDEVRGTACIAGELAYVGSYDQHLYALEARDGGILWRFRSHRGIVSRPLATKDKVILGSEDYSVYSLHAANGRLAWTFRTAMPVRSSPTLHGDAILIGSDDGYCYCLDEAQGHLLWRHRTWGPVRSTPVVADEMVYVGSDDGSIYGLSITDGRQRWRQQLGRPVMSTTAVARDVLVVGCNDGGVYGIDRTNGGKRWVARTAGPVIASPRILADRAIVGSADGKLYALSILDGSVLWSAQIATQITGSVAIEGSIGYVGTIDGYVYCLSLDEGETIWSHRLGSPIVATPAVSGSQLIVGALDGKVYGLRAS